MVVEYGCAKGWAISEKKTQYNIWQRTRKTEDWENYKVAQMAMNKAVSKAKYEAYDDLYIKLGTNKGEKRIYKLYKVRERRSRDMDHVRCIRDENQRVLDKE